MGYERTLGFGAMLFAVSMAMGCGVDRDLSRSRFSCAQGGLCDAGTVADSGSTDSGSTDSGSTDSGPADSGPVDAGPVDLQSCPGTYDGFTSGTDRGSIEGSLFDDGTFALTFRSARHTSGQLVRLKVQPDRTVELVSGADELTGFFDTGRCAASGSWLLNGFGGPWEIWKE